MPVRVPSTAGTVLQAQSLGRQNIDAPLEAFGAMPGLQQLGRGAQALSAGLQEMQRKRDEEEVLRMQDERSRMREEVEKAYNEHITQYRGSKAPEAGKAWQQKYAAIAGKYGKTLTGKNAQLFQIFVRDTGTSHDTRMSQFAAQETDRHVIETAKAENAAIDRMMEDDISYGELSYQGVSGIIDEYTNMRSHVSRTIGDRFKHGDEWMKAANADNRKHNALRLANIIAGQYERKGIPAEEAAKYLTEIEDRYGIDTKKVRDDLMIRDSVNVASRAIKETAKPDDMSAARFQAQIVSEAQKRIDGREYMSDEAKEIAKREVDRRVSLEWENQIQISKAITMETLGSLSSALAGKSEAEQADIVDAFITTNPSLTKEAQSLARDYYREDQPGTKAEIGMLLLKDVSMVEKRAIVEDALKRTKASGALRLDTEKKLKGLEDENIRRKVKEALTDLKVGAEAPGAIVAGKEWAKLDDVIADAAFNYFLTTPKGTIREFKELVQNKVIRRNSEAARSAIEGAISLAADQRMRAALLKQEETAIEKAKAKAKKGKQ